MASRWLHFLVLTQYLLRYYFTLIITGRKKKPVGLHKNLLLLNIDTFQWFMCLPLATSAGANDIVSFSVYIFHGSIFSTPLVRPNMPCKPKPLSELHLNLSFYCYSLLLLSQRSVYQFMLKEEIIILQTIHTF